MLKGEAKTRYMREYMRRKRAGQPTATKPKPEPRSPAEWEPPQRMVDQITWWRKKPWGRRGLGHRLFAKLPFADNRTWTEDNMLEACRLYQAMLDERSAEREREKEEEAKPRVARCNFCREPASPERILVDAGGDGCEGIWCICETCVANAAAVIAEQRRSGSAPSSS